MRIFEPGSIYSKSGVSCPDFLHRGDEDKEEQCKKKENGMSRKRRKEEQCQALLFASRLQKARPDTIDALSASEAHFSVSCISLCFLINGTNSIKMTR